MKKKKKKKKKSENREFRWSLVQHIKMTRGKILLDWDDDIGNNVFV